VLEILIIDGNDSIRAGIKPNNWKGSNNFSDLIDEPFKCGIREFLGF
jgi:hypothetical protein